MAQCKGTTKAGARCKRSSAEDSEFCSIHAPEEAPSSSGQSGENEPSGDTRSSNEWSGPAGMDLAGLLIGAAATVAIILLFKRVPRFPG